MTNVINLYFYVRTILVLMLIVLINIELVFIEKIYNFVIF